MAKATSVFACQECGATHSKWSGRCDACGAWNTIIEESGNAEAARPGGLGKGRGKKIEFVGLATPADHQKPPRLPTGLAEFDRVAGGGLVPGSAILVGGDPGIGKSTLLLQVTAALAGSYRCVYISGEEAVDQVRLRAERLGLADAPVELASATNVRDIVASLDDAHAPQVVVADSIQTLFMDTLDSAPGTVAQVRASAQELIRLCKRRGIVLFLVGHVTKEGTIAGPRVLEHIVDTVLYFEGDTHSSFRLVRAFKNRFGAVNELGVFAMTDKGLKGVSNPSALFLSQHDEPVPGSCVMVTQEGSRPLLVEIQALVDDAHAPNPRRLSVGLEQARLAMLLAVLHRHVGVACYDQDVFINAVGGVKIGEPAADLAVMLAIISSLKGKPLPKGLVVFGEVGLAGEIRPAPRGQERLREAAKLGFTQALIPKANAPRQAIPGLEVIAVDRAAEALARFR